MHMADALLSPAVGATMCAVSTAANALAVKQFHHDNRDGKNIPLMGITGAFVFAAQMVNFTIPGTGSSGHIGGGILLAALLGGYPALLSLTAVLLIQCLFFADGGLLALGCNIFNLGVIPCLIIYPLILRPFLRKKITPGRITFAAIVAVVIGLQLGSFGVVLETYFSGIAALPFSAFAVLMQPIHLAIGLAEGLITAMILCFIYRMRPEIMNTIFMNNKSADFEHRAVEISHPKVSRRSITLGKVSVILLVLTLMTGGVLSYFASARPDGLEWAIAKTAGTDLTPSNDNTAIGAAIRNAALMPDYDFKPPGGAAETAAAGTAAAGIIGSLLTFLMVTAAAGLIYANNRRRNKIKNKGMSS